ncbi:TonB-dependent receptor [Campylobacter sp. MIT 12-5580]|uniref:TonB-dependent receptor domain-containing protein n=1 Tax=Campylobacter sp. MIT 12-5580 TaxID=2040651 RepID=UPI0010F70631|nr:TonB-dependent receptor [Campylobacter sp. MIT 12-5580]TKX28665.1 TonB-dependent receptor [Campylobacter sp. MIT 12-5580]
MQEEILEFDTLEVSGTNVKNDEKPFITPGAVSSREGINTDTQSLDSIVRSIPGGFTQVDESQGTISVNIRGLTGLGRVNTQVDGVTQTFFGSSEDQGRYHANGKIVGTSAFGAAIDQNLLVGVDMQRGTFSGAGGANALMGSANFRTIGISDIISDNRSFGVLTKYSYGSNKLGPSYMGAVAGKYNFTDDGFLGLMYAYSGRKLSQGYKIGGGGLLSDLGGNDADGDGRPDNAAFDQSNLTQKPINKLAKVEFQKNASSAVLSYRRYDNELAGREINDDNYQLNYRFDPETELVDLRFLAAYHKADQYYNETASFMQGAAGKMKGVATNTAITLDLSNAFYFDLNEAQNLTSTLGVNFLSNSYDRDFDTSSCDPNDSMCYDYDNGTYINYFRYGFAPEGKQKITTIYLDNTYNYEIFELNANVNAMYYELSADKGACREVNSYCEPKEAGYFKQKDMKFNTSLMASLKLHTLFTPFISYSRTHRAPNVQEFFFSSTYDDFQDINTGLRPEFSDTYQIGFNSFKHGLISEHDVFGFKATYFYTDVKDYIYNKSIGNINDTADSPLLFLSFNGEAKFSGIESELYYDAGFAYAKISYTHQNADRQISENEANAGGGGSANIKHTGQSQFSTLPKDIATADLGLRFWDKRIVFGTLIKYTGKTERVNPILTNVSNGTTPGAPEDNTWAFSTQELPKIPTIIDLYASFEPLKNFVIRSEVQNLQDRNYMDALYTYNSSSAQVAGNDITLFNNAARGRTFVIGFSYKY